jgi:hypothetical protein
VHTLFTHELGMVLSFYDTKKGGEKVVVPFWPENSIILNYWR